MENVTDIIEYLNWKQEYYNDRVDFPSYAMSEIIDSFKGKSGTLTKGDIEYGFFRSLEANFVRHPKSYQACTSIDLANNEIWDDAVCLELVKLFRKVAQIQRGDI